MRAHRIAILTLLAMVLAVVPAAAQSQTYDGVEFPEGDASFADEVIDYSPLGERGCPSQENRDPEAALGPPDVDQVGFEEGAVSLGPGGEITLRFTDNVLTGSGDPEEDLWIFEVGQGVEDTFVEISADGSTWEDIGKVSGSTAGVDLDAFGFDESDNFEYVRLTDDPDEGRTCSERPSDAGADIDAVGAISTTLKAPDERLSGSDRLDTAVAVSQDSYPEDGSASSAVLARADVFADALSGTPLAVQEDAPMLVTPSGSLAAPVAEEIDRVLGGDGSKTVYLLGGTAALSPQVEQQVEDLGYGTVRIAGSDRIETAIEVAEVLEGVDKVLITTGYDFPDALSAGPAAAVADGAVLLTIPDSRAPATDAYLSAHPDLDRIAVGGPAARGYPEAEAIVGSTREGTAVGVAQRFFEGPPAVGIARSDDFPDALTGGAHIGALTAIAGAGGPMLLTSPTQLSEVVHAYICVNSGAISGAAIYGGELAIPDSVKSEVDAAVDGRNC